MWLISDSGVVVSQYNVFDLLWEAYGKTATVGNGLEGFRATGLWSAHRQFFTECDFAPREVLRGSETPDREEIREHDPEERTVQLKKLTCSCIIHTLLCQRSLLKKLSFFKSASVIKQNKAAAQNTSILKNS
jgi:hypothetical protein